MTPQQRLRMLRGRAYSTLLKEILGGEVGAAVIRDAHIIKQSTNAITVRDIGVLMLRYDLSFKVVCEWLEETDIVPCGTYDRLKERGLKVRDVLAAVYQEQAV